MAFPVSTRCRRRGTIADVWDKVGHHVRARRNELRLTTEQLAKRAKVSARLLGDLENGRRDNYDAQTLIRVEHALRWVQGSIAGILNGGEPVSVADDVVEQIAQQLARDDFVLTTLLAQSGLNQVNLFRLNLRIRARREQQAIELLGEVAGWITEAGGYAPDPVWPPHWLMELIKEQDTTPEG